MGIIRIEQGGGITERASLALGGSWDDMRDTLRRAAASATFESWIAEAEQTARAIRAAGGAELDIEGNQTPTWYARRILRLVAVARGAIRRNDVAAAAYHSVRLGALVREADLKFAHEADALRGAEYSRRQSEASRGRKGLKIGRDLDAAEEYLRRRRARDAAGGSRSDTALMIDVGRLPKFKLRRSAAISAINRGLSHPSLSENIRPDSAGN